MRELSVLAFVLGFAVFGYLVWGMWGSDLYVAQKQEMAVDRVRLREARPTSSSTVSPNKVVETKFEIGDTVGVIEIPKINITRPIIEGVGEEELKDGVGRLETSPLPSKTGNLVLAGHRVTYGKPFHNVDKLVKGDTILVEVQGVKYTYRVTGSKIVKPNDLSVLASTKKRTVTLIACHPKFSAAERYIVFGELVERTK